MTEETWIRIWAAGVITVGTMWVRQTSFKVEIEGQEPFATVRGRAAIVSGIILILLGVLLLVWPQLLTV